MTVANIITLCAFTILSLMILYTKIQHQNQHNSKKTSDLNTYLRLQSIIDKWIRMIDKVKNEKTFTNMKNSVEARSYVKCIIKESVHYHHQSIAMPLATYLRKKCFNESESNVNNLFCKWKDNKLVGALFVNKTEPSNDEIRNILSDVQTGGKWSPSQCKSTFKTAIIIPFRDRISHLNILLRHLHPILQRQNQNYQVFVIHQEDDNPFNRAKLMNVGFNESIQIDSFDCFIFHDVDLLPENDRNDYSCHFSPSHLSVAVDILGYRLPYQSSFGGVEAFKRSHFERINGFSNEYWGWGAEDDDLFARTQWSYLRIHRPNYILGRYQALHHDKAEKGNSVDDKYNNANGKTKVDGINSLTYKVIKKNITEFFTMITVDLLKEKFIQEDKTNN